MKKQLTREPKLFKNFFSHRHGTAVVLFAWLALHMYLSDQRGFWVDEWFRYRQMNMGFFTALKDLFSEISPFAPGELVLAYLNKALFSHFFSEELWMRLHSVYFGVLTLWVALRSKERFLAPLVFFSVALTALSTQFRPYSALIFGGALSFYLIRKKEPLDAVDQFFCWFNLFFGHIYGICFASFAFFFRRDFVKVAVSVAYLAVVMAIHYSMRTPFHFVRDIPPAIDVVKQTLGTIGNPQKAAYFFLIFCVMGLAHLFKKNRKQSYLLGTLLFLSTVGPVIATYLGKYYFLPRQVAGGTFIFLGLTAIGLQVSCEYLKKRLSQLASHALTATAVAVILASWMAFLMGTPPFIDQPLHRFEQIATAAKERRYKNVLWLDSGTMNSAQFYFRSVYSDPTAEGSEQLLGGLKTQKLCVAKTTCVYIMTENAFVWDSLKMAQTPEVKRLIEGKVVPFDIIVHSFYKFPLETSTPTLRIW
jgi:hypothetical protein